MSTLLPSGTIVHGRYRITRLIGQGGMGAVYAAIDETFKSQVALKQMFPMPHLTAQQVADLERAFQREAHLLHQLRHPALPRVSDYFTDAYGRFLVMDYIEGENLATLLAQRQRIERKPLTEAEVVAWAIKVLDALEYLHQQQPPIIHRDIKPDNITLTPNDEIFLLDFGIAKGSTMLTTLMGQRSVYAYTLAYASLEQVQGAGTDARSDLFSLAATMYHLLSGHALDQPPRCDVLTRAAARVKNEPDPLLLPPNLSPGLRQVLQQALALDPDDRPPNAAAMRQALLDTQKPSGSGRLVALVLAVVLLVIGFLIGDHLWNLASSIFVPGRDSTYVPIDSVAAGIETVTGKLPLISTVLPETSTMTAVEATQVIQTEGAMQATDAIQIEATVVAQLQATQVAARATDEAQAIAATVAAQVQATTEALSAPDPTPVQPGDTVPDRLSVALQWPVAFADTFTSSTGTWFTGNYANPRVDGTIRIENGVHHWQVTPFQDTTWWLRPSIPPVANFYLEARMQRISGASDSSYGVIFRLQENGGFRYYRFMVTDTGGYEVALVDRGDTTTLIPRSPVTHLQLGAMNRIAVIGAGSQFTFYVNDHYVDTLTDHTLSQGQVGIIIGLIAYDEAVFETRSFTLRTP